MIIEGFCMKHQVFQIMATSTASRSYLAKHCELNNCTSRSEFLYQIAKSYLLVSNRHPNLATRKISLQIIIFNKKPKALK